MNSQNKEKGQSKRKKKRKKEGREGGKERGRDGQRLFGMNKTQLSTLISPMD
jgi:hypothetical protein